MKADNPIVFISYSWDNSNHENWVLKLATDLRHHGVDVILDKWDARLGSDLPFFMEQGLTKSKLVLCICSKEYTKKANEGVNGVGYEKRIISADLLSGENKGHVIPIIRNNPTKIVPTFLKGIKWTDFIEDSKYFQSYSELLARIYDEDLSIKPPLGENPFISSKLSESINQIVKVQDVDFYNPAFVGIVEFDYTRNSGKITIGSGEFVFTIAFSTCGYNSIHCYKDYIFRIGYNPNYKDFTEPDNFSSFDFTSRCKSLNEGEVLVLENDNHKFAMIKIIQVRRNSVDLNHLVEFEYKIYTLP